MPEPQRPLIILEIQYNYDRRCKNIIVALETLLSIGAGIIYLQEPFIRNKNMIHSVLNSIGLEDLEMRHKLLQPLKKSL